MRAARVAGMSNAPLRTFGRSATGAASTSSAPAASISSSASGSSQSRSGLFIRQRLLQNANKLVEGASRLVNNAIEGEDLMAPRAAKPSPYTQEKVLVFPGYAFVRNGELTVSIEGFAFALRPLESASRTQKLFVSGARQLASLPTLPKGGYSDEPLDVELSPEELKRQTKQYNEQHKEIQSHEHHDAHPLQQHGSAPSRQGTPSSSLAPPSTSYAQYQVRSRNPTRQGTTSSIASNASTASTQTIGTLTRPPRGVDYSGASLEVLHDNLNTRLRLFFSQKLVSRRIRVSVYLDSSSSSSDTTSNTSERSAEQCVARGTLVTELGGVFKSTITVPWKYGDPSGRPLRIRTELLGSQASDEGDATIDSQEAHDRVMAMSDEASISVTHAHAPIRVISDIDDTIKATHVLAGIKSVFRNVFTRPHEELAVEGMKDWYWEMYEKGACFHFVSNSPFELFGVLREYLQAVGFPPGSVRLKEYGGGSGSLLGGLWEPAGQRKRGGVEEILRTFPDSHFLLVGDSGEQDLELYVSLARQFPRQILGVFIRDVTTPVPRPRRNSSRSSLLGKSLSSLPAFSSKTPSRSSSVATTQGVAAATPPPLPARPGAAPPNVRIDDTARPAEVRHAGRGTASGSGRSLERRNSDEEQARNLAQLAIEEKERERHEAAKELERLRNSPEALVGDLQAGQMDDADLLSDNNSLDRNSLEHGLLAPLDKDGYTEMERKVVNLFKERVDRARQEMPKGIILRIFRSGEECREDADRLLKEWGEVPA